MGNLESARVAPQKQVGQREVKITADDVARAVIVYDRCSYSTEQLRRVLEDYAANRPITVELGVSWLESVIASIRMYPNGGGDVRIMTALDELLSTRLAAENTALKAQAEALTTQMKFMEAQMHFAQCEEKMAMNAGIELVAFPEGDGLPRHSKYVNRRAERAEALVKALEDDKRDISCAIANEVDALTDNRIVRHYETVRAARLAAEQKAGK